MTSILSFVIVPSRGVATSKLTLIGLLLSQGDELMQRPQRVSVIPGQLSAWLDDSLFAFAGLWDLWRDPTGTVIESCTILTTTPNLLLADVHDRMPVILRQGNYNFWLDPNLKDVKALAEILAPFDAAQMRSFPVSARINGVVNDDPDCVVPWHNSLPAQSALFG